MPLCWGAGTTELALHCGKLDYVTTKLKADTTLNVPICYQGLEVPLASISSLDTKIQTAESSLIWSFWNLVEWAATKDLLSCFLHVEHLISHSALVWALLGLGTTSLCWDQWPPQINRVISKKYSFYFEIFGTSWATTSSHLIHLLFLRFYNCCCH